MFSGISLEWNDPRSDQGELVKWRDYEFVGSN